NINIIKRKNTFNIFFLFYITQLLKMILIVRMVVPRYSGAYLVKPLSKDSYLIEVRKTNGPFSILHRVFFSKLIYLFKQCLSNLNIIYHVQPSKSHLLFLLVVYFFPIYNRCYFACQFTIFVGKIKFRFGIFKSRVFIFIKTFQLIINNRWYPVRV